MAKPLEEPLLLDDNTQTTPDVMEVPVGVTSTPINVARQNATGQTRHPEGRQNSDTASIRNASNSFKGFMHIMHEQNRLYNLLSILH